MTTLIESLNAKARANVVYDMSLEELIAWHGSQTYSPIGQATLNHLESLQRGRENAQRAKMTQANRADPQSKFQASLRADINACEAVYPSMGPNDNFCYGLTKRERFAMAAMEGVLAGGARYEDADIAKRAIGTADALLKELAK